MLSVVSAVSDLSQCSVIIILENTENIADYTQQCPVTSTLQTAGRWSWLLLVSLSAPSKLNGSKQELEVETEVVC